MSPGPAILRIRERPSAESTVIFTAPDFTMKQPLALSPSRNKILPEAKVESDPALMNSRFVSEESSGHPCQEGSSCIDEGSGSNAYTRLRAAISHLFQI